VVKARLSDALLFFCEKGTSRFLLLPLRWLGGRNDKTSISKNVVKGVKAIESPQVTAMMGNIKFDFFPVTPWQFAILEIES
jgi:hypothetical protein